MSAKPKLIKICLTNGGADVETPWAHDLGAVTGGRKVRLVNVPFLHAKPTWGDVIVVAAADRGPPMWDRRGVAFDKIGARILEDGGRWAMIVDYLPHPDGDAFAAIERACLEHDIVCERAVSPRSGRAGRVYLAVKQDRTDVATMAQLRAAELPCELIQIHPKPVAKTKRKKPPATAKARARRRA